MDWKKTQVPQGGKLYKIHTFNYMFKGMTYMLEVDEYADGTYSGHGEHSTDKNSIIGSVSGGNVEACLNALISKIQTRT